MSSLVITQATIDDLDEIMEVELSWPDGEAATVEKFESRLNIFPKGFFVARINNEMVGTITSCPYHYDPEKMSQVISWEQVTNDGYLYSNSNISSNAIYLVSAVVKQGARGRGVFEGMVSRVTELASELGLPYVVAGAVLPGYDSYCKRNGEIAAEEYVFTKKGSKLVDPFMEIYRKINFHVPDKDHVLDDYYGDSASRSYSAMVVHKVEN